MGGKRFYHYAGSSVFSVPPVFDERVIITGRLFMRFREMTIMNMKLRAWQSTNPATHDSTYTTMPVSPGKRSIGYARSWIECTPGPDGILWR